MSQSIRALVAMDDGVDRDAVQSALPVEAHIHIVGLVDGLEESWATLQETPTDLLVVACAGYSDRALFLVDGAVKQRPDRPVLVVSNAPSNGFVKRVFEAGADDFLTLPQSPSELAFAMEKAVARKQGSAAATGVAVSPMVCILGPKGGTGKTLTACNLAVGLAESGHRVAIVDLDLQFGDVGLALGLAPERTVFELAKSGGTLDGEKIDAYLTKHDSGVAVLMAPTRPDHAGVITTEFLREVYAAIRATHDFLIVDTPPGFTPEVIASIDSSTHICMVGMLDSLSLKNTKLGLETLDLMGYDKDRIKLVLNRADSRVGISAEDVAAVIGRTPDVTIPSDRDIPRSINEGVPIVRAKKKSDAAKAFRTLAGLYVNRDAARSNGGRRLFRRRRA